MISKNLKNALNERKMSIQELADASGIPLETVKNLYYGRVRDPKVSTMMSISEALDVTINYLLGSSSMDADEQEVLRCYRNCGVHGKGVIRFVAGFESRASSVERGSLNKHRIPCLIPQGAVKDGIIYNSCDAVDIYTSLDNATVAVEITTNYFAPAYCRGDRILLESRFPENKERAVFADGQKFYFRQYIEESSGYRLRCLNGHGEDITLKRMDTFECIGTCIGVVRG